MAVFMVIGIFAPHLCMVSISGSGGGGMLGTCPPVGPNSFVFAYIFVEKHPHQGSTPHNGSMPPPMGNPRSAIG